MKLHDYILKEVPTFTLKSTIESAQKICKELPITHVFIVEEGNFIGCFSESDIQTLENKDENLGTYSYLLQSFFTDENHTVLELLKQFSEYESNMIPVIDKEKKYLGYYDLSDILDVFATSPFLNEEQVTLVVEKTAAAYSMSEVAQIAESNHGKILGMYISKRVQDKVEISLRIAPKEMNEMIQTFRRYQYTIVTEHKDDFYLEELKNRSKYLQKYLSV